MLVAYHNTKKEVCHPVFIKFQIADMSFSVAIEKAGKTAFL